MTKQVLRAQTKVVLRAIPQNELQLQSRQLLQALEPIIMKYNVFGCYVNMDVAEAQTGFILRRIFALKKSVYLPRCTSTKITGQVPLVGNKVSHPHLTFHEVHSMEQVEDLKPSGKYGLREPPDDGLPPLPPADIEVLLIPGVAFDLSNGGRIGHGAGFYDDYVHRCLHYNHKVPLLVGLALKQQIVIGLPMETHDEPMDAIACGDGSLHWIRRL
ncbi:5-formyltetrahydrofolate cyclo-ligase Ecym_7477 [Eremothecium cymbalariae DBVPG|uniref:5-formyltetrahydrofolate cyclo-ligase n=1 Tax=Eremothecium cymbalariae (strain CBS 270.75 / DBVPG 7215 / KCTC 17166 / NRRL Y-17582) TaxID=931890 RepID=G8JWS9_ERECY|nr:hypothetical protein Ecym_7477 [Eremothecium cymbalariae DBVPG\